MKAKPPADPRIRAAIEALAEAIAELAVQEIRDAKLRLPAAPLASSLRAASRRYGISRETLGEAIHNGELPAARVGRRFVVLHADVEKWLRARAVEPRLRIEQRVESILAREARRTRKSVSRGRRAGGNDGA